MAEIVCNSSILLLDIVNDILDLSKIESGAVQLENIGFDLSYVMHSLVDRLNPLAITKKLAPLQLEDSKPPFVRGDPLRITKILTNLVSNAIKYTQKGAVSIKVSHIMVSDSQILYRCDVTDSGIGIPASQHKNIFDKFTQADTSTTRRHGGTGLGLAITKHLVELMGGTITVISEIDKGSVFSIEIPFNITDQVYRDKDNHVEIAHWGTLKPAETRVLVAEDNAINQLFVKKLMKKFGILNFRIVDHGKAALEAYQNDAWDIILMDCHMPEMNGYDATSAIRNLEKAGNQHVPIIAMTANAMVGDREKCLQCGMDDYVSKPIILEELVKVLGRWIALQEIDTPKK